MLVSFSIFKNSGFCLHRLDNSRAVCPCVALPKSSAALSFLARVGGGYNGVKRNVYTSAPPRFFTPNPKVGSI